MQGDGPGGVVWVAAVSDAEGAGGEGGGEGKLVQGLHAVVGGEGPRYGVVDLVREGGWVVVAWGRGHACS